MSTPQPLNKREVPFEEAMSRAVEAEAVDEEQMRSLLPPEKGKMTEAKEEMPSSPESETPSERR